MDHFFFAIRYTQTLPQIRAVSSGCRDQKGNDKEKCKAERVIHLLDPLGKAHAGQIWAKRLAYGSDNSTGFKPRRRREQTILQVKLARWHLEAHKTYWVAPFYDQANAFASVDHITLDGVVKSALPPGDADLLCQRHARALCFLRADSGDWALLSLGCGDLQGDVGAPDKFINVLDPCVDRWIQQSESAKDREFFHVIEPVTQKLVNFSYGSNADDMFRMGLCTDAKEAAARIREWDSLLHVHVSVPTGLCQNADKKGSVVSCIRSRFSRCSARLLS